ncbi:TPA: hypothetical protein ACKP5I_000949 [Stenotrophomonas maltophilia]|uniref:hypothetical protein n=1 Tax=Stenotrophomonas maltophilia TaxID=40324 RepID=UPI001FA739D6|nr:hypothetical protein [Stenotrophomonas maltophilia]
MSSEVELAPDGFVWCGKKGDLTLYLTHIVRDSDDDAALYIRNENRRVEGINPVTGMIAYGSPAYVVPFRDFWIFRPEDKDRGRHHHIGDMVARLQNASVALYGLDVPAYRHRIHDAILEFCEDVKNLRPPAEQTREQWLGEMARMGIQIKINGQKVN